MSYGYRTKNFCFHLCREMFLCLHIKYFVGGNMRFLLIIYVYVYELYEFIFCALAPLCSICLYEFIEMQEHELSVYALV